MICRGIFDRLVYWSCTLYTCTSFALFYTPWYCTRKLSVDVPLQVVESLFAWILWTPLLKKLTWLFKLKIIWQKLVLNVQKISNHTTTLLQKQQTACITIVLGVLSHLLLQRLKKVHNLNARHSSTDLILSEVRLEVGKRGFYYQEAHMCSLPSVYFKISLSVKEHIVAIFTNFNQFL